MRHTGEEFAVAALFVDRSPASIPSAAAARDEVARRFEDAGWPVETEPELREGAWWLRVGPALVRVSRSWRGVSKPADLDPDDPEHCDLDDYPNIALEFPERQHGMVMSIAAVQQQARVHARANAQELPGLVEGASRSIAEARSATRSERSRRSGERGDRCRVCQVSYPEGSLLAKTRGGICPTCAFSPHLDEDASPKYLTHDLDNLAATVADAPAGWAGPAALLACAAGTGFADQLAAERWDTPRALWSDWTRVWVWLAPPDRRPACLAGLSVGVGLGALVGVLDEAFPELRAALYADLRADRPDLDAHMVERMWPCLAAYAIALDAQAAERPGAGSPWMHLAFGRSTLADHLEEISSPFAGDPRVVEAFAWLLEHAIPLLAARIGIPAVRSADLTTRWVAYHAPVFVQVRVDETGRGHVTGVVSVQDPGSFTQALDASGRPIVYDEGFGPAIADEVLDGAGGTAPALAADLSRWPGRYGGAWRSESDPRGAGPAE